MRRVEAALAGGAGAIQYRSKGTDAALRHRQAEALARITTERGALFIVNDDPALCAAVGADGVHLGEDDGSPAVARAIIGPERIIGVSCYNDFALAEAAVAAGADYVAFGSFFPSSVKPDARRADVALLARAGVLDVPVVAIGGITAENAGDLQRAGAARGRRDLGGVRCAGRGGCRAGDRAAVGPVVRDRLTVQRFSRARAARSTNATLPTG